MLDQAVAVPIFINVGADKESVSLWSRATMVAFAWMSQPEDKSANNWVARRAPMRIDRTYHTAATPGAALFSCMPDAGLTAEDLDSAIAAKWKRLPPAEWPDAETAALKLLQSAEHLHQIEVAESARESASYSAQYAMRHALEAAKAFGGLTGRPQMPETRRLLRAIDRFLNPGGRPAAARRQPRRNTRRDHDAR